METVFPGVSCFTCQYAMQTKRRERRNDLYCMLKTISLEKKRNTQNFSLWLQNMDAKAMYLLF